jgi:hypothetical protein
MKKQGGLLLAALLAVLAAGCDIYVSGKTGMVEISIQNDTSYEIEVKLLNISNSQETIFSSIKPGRTTETRFIAAGEYYLYYRVPNGVSMGGTASYTNLGRRTYVSGTIKTETIKSGIFLD